MRTLLAVIRTKGPAWDATKPMRKQAQWAEHALFMNKLAADGFIILGGPLGDSGDVLLVVNAASEDEVTSRLLEDPWSQSGILEIKSIHLWQVLLEAGGQSGR